MTEVNIIKEVEKIILSPDYKEKPHMEGVVRIMGGGKQFLINKTALEDIRKGILPETEGTDHEETEKPEDL